MKICSSTKVLSGMPLCNALRMIAETGYDGAEIWVEQIWRSDISITTLKALFKELNLHITLHAPAGDLNITSTDDEIREISLTKTTRALELGSDLGVHYVTVHPGRKTSTKDPEEENWELQLEGMTRLAEAGDRLGVSVGVENMEQRPLEVIILPDRIRKLVSEVGSTSLAVTFDIAHAATVRSLGPLAYMAALGEFDHVHLSDSSTVKTHLPLGEGELNLTEILTDLRSRFDGYVAIEGYVPNHDEKVVHDNYSFWKNNLQ